MNVFSRLHLWARLTWSKQVNFPSALLGMFRRDWVWLECSFSGHSTWKKVEFFVAQPNSPGWLLGTVRLVIRSVG